MKRVPWVPWSMIANSSNIAVTITTTVSILMIIYGIATEKTMYRVCVYHKNFQLRFYTISTSVAVVDVATTAATDTRSLTPRYNTKFVFSAKTEQKEGELFKRFRKCCSVFPSLYLVCSLRYISIFNLSFFDYLCWSIFFSFLLWHFSVRFSIQNRKIRSQQFYFC